MKTQIIYEDGELLVCFKPAGLAVQSRRISEPDMVSELKNYLAKESSDRSDSTGMGGARRKQPSGKVPVYLGVIHRLDQPVSGIVVFAKTQRAAASLSRQTAEHLMRKTYRAVVMIPKASAAGCGGMEAPVLSGDGTENAQVPLSPGDGAGDMKAHVLTDYIRKESGGGARIAAPGEPDAKEAQLVYRCLARKGNRALLEIDLKTGRYHQIRVQMAHAGMPLLGDARYGSEESRELSERLGIRNVQLQAVKLVFTHPTTGKAVCFELEKKLEL